MPMLQSTVAPEEARLHRCVPSLPAIRPDRLRTAKVLVEKAVKSRKVFSVQGSYPVIRAALCARGWVERRLPRPPQKTPQCHGEEDDVDDGDAAADVSDRLFGEKEALLDDMYDLKCRLVRNEKTHLYWTTRRDFIDYCSLQNDQMTNHYANTGTFATKVGLCVNLRNLQWFDTADPDTFFPRCYRLGAEDEKHAFIEDFRRTACTSLLQHVVETSQWRREPSAENSDCENSNKLLHGPVGPEAVDTALQVCEEFLGGLKHADIDVTAETPPSVSEQQWAAFLRDYYLVVHKGALISGSSGFVERCDAMLARLQEVCPQLDTDGLNNIWIIKPGAKSRGRGIMCMNRLEEILALVDSDRAVMKDNKWVVQKYLERPLLVHGTKFDLRQWFLVTDWNPLTVWFYNECYLRFSTQRYSTTTLDSSVHLCNNSIQKHFQVSHDRHPGVPKDNMWSCSHFRSFLQQRGREAEWESVVVPGMQQAVIHALQTSQDLVKPRRASFELYGADFMLGRDLRPWLLEINISPTMACSTPVTARLCPAVQVDTLRVVLDHRTDPTANTGGFQLIYKQAEVEVPQCMGVNLLVEGAPIKQPRPLLWRQTAVSNVPLTVQFPSKYSSRENRETRQKSFGAKPDKSSAFRWTGENQQKSHTTSTSPKGESEMRSEGQNCSQARRSCRSLTCDQAPPAHTEPQRKARCLGLSLHVDGPTLVPRSLSFSLSPPHSQSEGKPQTSNAARRSGLSRAFLPPTTLELQRRTRTRTFPPIQGLLPGLEVHSLQPDVVAGTAVCRSSKSNFHKRQSFFHERQSSNRYKGENSGKPKREDGKQIDL